jgi:hypothetical protein
LVEVSRKRIAKPVRPLPSSHADVEGQTNSIKTAERGGKRAGFAQRVVYELATIAIRERSPN